jgi:hypothetical protein
MGERIVVTDGTNSFYESRGLFQLLHDFGSFEAITASSSSVADAKKMLLSREARYSGLVDVLKFSEDALGDALKGANTWLVVNADEAALASQIAAAKAAGVKRIFVHVSAAGADAKLHDAKALQTALEGSGADFTVMRARITKKAVAASLILAEIDEAELEEVPKEDTYRFITEALTLPEANGRMFSICPNEDDSQFREMRRAGCNRREEAQVRRPFISFHFLSLSFVRCGRREEAQVRRCFSFCFGGMRTIRTSAKCGGRGATGARRLRCAVSLLKMPEGVPFALVSCRGRFAVPRDAARRMQPARGGSGALLFLFFISRAPPRPPCTQSGPGPPFQSPPPGNLGAPECYQQHSSEPKPPARILAKCF